MSPSFDAYYGKVQPLYILEMRDICFNNIDCLLLSVPNFKLLKGRLEYFGLVIRNLCN